MDFDRSVELKFIKTPVSFPLLVHRQISANQGRIYTFKSAEPRKIPGLLLIICEFCEPFCGFCVKKITILTIHQFSLVGHPFLKFMSIKSRVSEGGFQKCGKQVAAAHLKSFADIWIICTPTGHIITSNPGGQEISIVDLYHPNQFMKGN